MGVVDYLFGLSMALGWVCTLRFQFLPCITLQSKDLLYNKITFTSIMLVKCVNCTLMSLVVRFLIQIIAYRTYVIVYFVEGSITHHSSKLYSTGCNRFDE